MIRVITFVITVNITNFDKNVNTKGQNMKDYLLFMDVAGDIDREFAKQYEINLLPMEVSLNDQPQTYTAGDDGMDLINFYEQIKKKCSFQTSLINPALYEEYFRPYLASGKSALYVCLSSGLSSTFQAAQMAAKNLKEEFPDVDLVPVDSLLATAPMGLLAERMAENKAAGKSIEENAADLNEMKHLVQGYLVVDDLNSLKRTGRIGAATAFFGSMLNIKPIITIYGGGLHMINKQKGIKKSLQVISEYFKENYDPTISTSVYIADANEPATADELEALVKEFAPNITIKRLLISPIVGAHVGPGSVLISFFSNKQCPFSK